LSIFLKKNSNDVVNKIATDKPPLMYKAHLLNTIVDEMKICRRLYTKIPHDKMDFRPKADMRSIHELLQYICIVGTALPIYWLNESDGDFFAAFNIRAAASKQIPHEEFLSKMNEQIELLHMLFGQIDEGELMSKEVVYPWGGKAPLGEALIASSVKFLTGYKLQLFLYIRMCTDLKLGTNDAWFITELD
jgi:hypothetical protein